MTTSERLKTLTAMFESDTPPTYPVNPATKKQINFILSIIRKNGIERYRQVKAELSITSKVGELTKDEAWRVIDRLERKR